MKVIQGMIVEEHQKGSYALMFKAEHFLVMTLMIKEPYQNANFATKRSSS